jgi:putative nucleotidyltransferase with HDIG domain
MKVRPTLPLLRTIPPPGASADFEMDACLARGQLLERQGKRDEARALYQASLLEPFAAAPINAAHLHRLIARALMSDGDFVAAEASAKAALEVSEGAGDTSGEARAVNTLAAIHWTQGSHDEAQRLYIEARKIALATGDALVAQMTSSNLGIIATVRGDDVEALRFYESALADARAGGLVDEASNTLVNLGMLHMHMNRLPESDRALSEAKAAYESVGDLSRLISTELHIARLRIKQGEQSAAKSSWERATKLALNTGDMGAEADAEQIAGLIARTDGDVKQAEAHFLRAEAIGAERKDLIIQAETAKELADLYRWNGRNKDTLQRLNQAHRLFLQLRARRELADVDRRTTLLESDFIDVARKWGETIEAKDIYTQGHCVRVADLSGAIWSRVGGGDAMSLFWFRIGALLHDVGKLMVPPEVLNKAGQLNKVEWELMKRHTTAGVELLADVEFPWDVRPIVESHHERWDGKGYPHGLAGEEIPLTARVLCIADVYDALTSKRSYKQAFSHDEAMEIMRGDVGTQFDPGLFGTFEDIVRRGTWPLKRLSGEQRVIGSP